MMNSLIHALFATLKTQQQACQFVMCKRLIVLIFVEIYFDVPQVQKVFALQFTRVDKFLFKFCIAQYLEMITVKLFKNYLFRKINVSDFIKCC